MKRDQCHHRRCIEDHDVGFDTHTQDADAGEEQAKRHSDDQGEPESGKEEFCRINQLRNEIAADRQLPKARNCRRERHHEGWAGVTPGNFPERNARENAEPEGCVTAECF